jgi:hypothetical protein
MTNSTPGAESFPDRLARIARQSWERRPRPRPRPAAPFIPPNTSSLEQIADALTRIADAVEELVEEERDS